MTFGSSFCGPTHRQIHPIMLGAARPPILDQGEAQRADSGGVVLGEGAISPLPSPDQLWSLGECCKLPQCGPRQSPGR